MPHKLVLNNTNEEKVEEYEEIERAFDAAIPWIAKGYVARITDKQGIVKYTQALIEGQIATYPGDATTMASDADSQHGCQPEPPRRNPWWRFW